jgi:hypothetical protein
MTAAADGRRGAGAPRISAAPRHVVGLAMTLALAACSSARTIALDTVPSRSTAPLSGRTTIVVDRGALDQSRYCSALKDTLDSAQKLTAAKAAADIKAALVSFAGATGVLGASGPASIRAAMTAANDAAAGFTTLLERNGYNLTAAARDPDYAALTSGNAIGLAADAASTRYTEDCGG